MTKAKPSSALKTLIDSNCIIISTTKESRLYIIGLNPSQYVIYKSFKDLPTSISDSSRNSVGLSPHLTSC